MRVLFDAGLVRVVAVPRAALACATSSNDAHLLFGSAPNIFTLSPKGQALLYREGLIDRAKPLPSYGPKNTLFLAHELMLTDARIWLSLCARQHAEHQVLSWHDGGEAAMDLHRTQPPKSVYPDAWFVYALGEQRLVGLLEVDRSTERGARRWKEKIAAYTALFSGSRLKGITGYAHARLMVITLTERRREALTSFIAHHAPAHLSKRFWLADHSIFATPGFSVAHWQRPSGNSLEPFIAPDGHHPDSTPLSETSEHP